MSELSEMLLWLLFYGSAAFLCLGLVLVCICYFHDPIPNARSTAERTIEYELENVVRGVKSAQSAGKYYKDFKTLSDRAQCILRSKGFSISKIGQAPHIMRVSWYLPDSAH